MDFPGQSLFCLVKFLRNKLQLNITNDPRVQARSQGGPAFLYRPLNLKFLTA